MAQRTRKLLPWLLTAISVAAMCGLGFWQLERMIQKQHRLASIAQKQSNGSVSLLTALTNDDPRDITVTFDGEPDTTHLVFLDNQIQDKRVGYDVIVPVRTNAGWVLVNYGWVSAPDMQRTLPTIKIDKGLLSFRGIVSVPGINPLITETNTQSWVFPALVQQIDFADLSQRLNRDLLPYVIQLTTDDVAFVRDFRPVVMSPEKHLGYAVQWFGLAVAAAAIGGFAISKKGRSYE
ncbi:SURF1 family protein [Alteromonas sp. S167]|uniref:SURF1 family protein n=1 Tax=Alteromonas sp. S167 TaxID=3117402 RepID=UPI002FE15AAC